MTDTDYKSILGSYYYNITWKTRETVPETLARSIVSVIRNDILEENVDTWDEGNEGCDWIKTYLYDFKLLGDYTDEDKKLICESGTVEEIQEALASECSIKFLCNFYLFSVVGGSSHPLCKIYSKVKQGSDKYDHPLIKFKTNM